MTTPTRTVTEVDLDIGGMTCASCAARVEKKLNRMPGVTATVNYATERAHVELPEGLAISDAIATVEATGYSASEPAKEDAAQEAREDDEVSELRSRVIISAILTIPVVILAMVPPLQFDYWQWLSLTLAAPVVVWGALPFHRAAWINLRHGAANMDTLVSMGVGAAFLWSLYALFFGGAGVPGMRMSFHLLPTQGGGSSEIYLEVAAAVTTFILLGRYFEARAKQRSSEALTTLMSMGAKDVAVLRDGREQRVAIDDRGNYRGTQGRCIHHVHREGKRAAIVGHLCIHCVLPRGRHNQFCAAHICRAVFPALPGAAVRVEHVAQFVAK